MAFSSSSGTCRTDPEGDIIVAGKNFGCGSSKRTGTGDHQGNGCAVCDRQIICKDLFFRNSINNGLLLIEQPDLYDDMKEGDEITVVMNEHVDYNGKGISDCFLCRRI